jgi:hypothetical protein
MFSTETILLGDSAMEDKLNRYKHMWTDNRDEYLLIEYVSKITNAINYGIYHLKSKTGLVLEDDSVSEQVIDEMIKAGVRITKEVPK